MNFVSLDVFLSDSVWWRCFFIYILSPKGQWFQIVTAPSGVGKLEWVSCLSRHAMSGFAVSHPYMTYLWLNIVWRLRLPLTDMKSVKQKLLRSDRLFSLSNYSADTFAKHIPQIPPATLNPLTHLCMFCTCESEVKSLSFFNKIEKFWFSNPGNLDVVLTQNISAPIRNLVHLIVLMS